MPINPQEISVVVQGPVVRDTGPDNNTNPTSVVLASVRRVLPGAELILSTWQGIDVAGLDCDRLVLSDDPGPWEWMGPKGMNVNRQIVSTRNGLATASRQYSIKLRTDTALENNGFARAFESDDLPRLPKFRVFTRRVVICSCGTIDPRRLPWLFFPGDQFLFGSTVDLRTNFEIDLGPVSWLSVPVAPEVFIWMSVLRKAGHPVKSAHRLGTRVHFGRWGGSMADFRASELALVNNYNAQHPTDLGLLLPRRMYPLLDVSYPAHRIRRLERTLLRSASLVAQVRYAVEGVQFLVGAALMKTVNQL